MEDHRPHPVLVREGLEPLLHGVALGYPPPEAGLWCNHPDQMSAAEAPIVGADLGTAAAQLQAIAVREPEAEIEPEGRQGIAFFVLGEELPRAWGEVS